MIGDKIYYYVGAGLVSLVVIYILIQLFNLHIRVNKSVIEQFSIIEGFSLPGSNSDKKSSSQKDDTETTNTLEAQHKDLRSKIDILKKSLDAVGKDELEDYLLDLDEYIDLSAIDGVTNPKGENGGMIVFSTFYKKGVENCVKYLNSDTSQINSSGGQTSSISTPSF